MQEVSNGPSLGVEQGRLKATASEVKLCRIQHRHCTLPGETIWQSETIVIALM